MNFDELKFENERLSTVARIEAKQSNTNEQARIDLITSIAIITRGLTDIKEERKDGLYKDLLVEGYGKTANRVFEFLPVVLKDVSFEGLCLTFTSGEEDITLTKEQSLNVLRYSYYDTKANNIYTNMRCLLKAGVQYEKVPYNSEEELENFKIIDMKIPMYIWAQLYTHTQLSKISESDRVSKNPVWDVNSLELPEDIVKKVFENIISDENIAEYVKKCDVNDLSDDEWLKFKFYDTLIAKDFIKEPSIDKIKNILMTIMSSDELYRLFKMLGYAKEICSRAIYYMRLKHSIFAGWKNDPNVWDNLVNERTNSWTQKDTKVIANQIKELIE